MDFMDVASKCGALFLTGFWPKGKGMGRRLLSGSMYRHCYLPELTPEHTSDPSDLGIPTYLFSRMGVYGTRQAGQNRAGL